MADRRGDQDGEVSRVVGCSVPGPSHEEDDVRCQDAWYGDTCQDSRFVIAVGDGLGSATLSHEGSQLATEEAVSELKQCLEREESIDQQAMNRSMKRAFGVCKQTLTDRAAELEQPPEALNTTLLAAVAGPTGAAAAAVGDGGVVYHHEGTHNLLIPRERTEYANQTTPILSDHWEDSFRFGYRDDIEAVALFTDGLDPFVWDTDSGTSPRETFFDRVFSYIRSTRDWDAATEELCQFLNDELFREYSGDDKTIALGVLPRETAPTRVHDGGRRTVELFDRIRSWL